MKIFEGQYNFQDELDRAGSHQDALEEEKARKDADLLQQEKARQEALRLEQVKEKELERLKELENNDNPSNEYFNRFNKWRSNK